MLLFAHYSRGGSKLSNTPRLAALAAAIALAALTAGGGAPARGASFTVNATHDAVDAAAGDGVCADAGGACTPRAAVMEANALPGADVVAVSPGSYVLTVGVGGDHITSLIVRDSLAIVGAGADSTTIDGNQNYNMQNGGIFYLPCGITKSDVSISGLTIWRGLAEGGGGIDNCGHNLNVRAVAFVENGGASLYGGGLRNRYGYATIEDSLFVHNSAQRGSAIDNGGVLTLTNVTVSGNESIQGGGAVSSLGEATLTNVSIVANVNAGNLPGGLLGNFALNNTLLAANTGSGNCAGAVSSFGHNLSSDGTCGFTSTGDFQNTEPQLTGLQHNGGPTLIHGLYPNSPAIDAGDPNSCPATDQRGVARPQGAACDIGAYEYVTPPTAPPAEPPTDAPRPADPATEPPTSGPTPKPKPSTSPSPSPVPNPSATAARTQRRLPTPAAAVLVDAPEQVVEEDAGGGVSPMAAGLAAAGALGIASSAATGGFFWHRKRRGNRLR